MSSLLDLSSPQRQPGTETQLEPQEEASSESYPKYTHTTGNAAKNPKAMSLPIPWSFPLPLTLPEVMNKQK